MWTSRLNLEVKSAALDLGRQVAKRLSELETVKQSVELTAKQRGVSTNQVWGKASIANGSAGLAVLFSYLDACFPDEGWDLHGKQHLELASRGLEEDANPNAGLFGGLAGVGFAAQCLSRNGTRYKKLLSTIDGVLCARTEELCFSIRRDTSGVSASLFDVVSGLTGIGRYLLVRRSFTDVSSTLESVLEAIQRLSQEHKGLPRWWTPTELYLNPVYKERFPSGLLDCGLAHGIAGPLSLLSIAMLKGVNLVGISDTVASLSHWLTKRYYEDRYGINWAPMIPLQLQKSGDLEEARTDSLGLQDSASRTAWCYGIPGIARALFLASRAIGDGRLAEIAKSSMLSAIARPYNERLIDSPTFCHGSAGFLQIALRFASDVGSAEFDQEINSLVNRLIGDFQVNSLLGFQDLDNEGRRIDNPCLLEGAASVSLVLLSASCDVEPTWDSLFMLS